MTNIADTEAVSFLMRRVGGHIVLSATDLSSHLGCRHKTELDRAVAEGQRSLPDWHDPRLAILTERGLAHEQAYVEALHSQGLQFVAFDEDQANPAKTEAAMRAGADVIVQAALAIPGWGGRADVLRRVNTPSELGAWSYEAVDAKLAQNTRAGTILQLCLYSEMIAAVQGRMPDVMHVVKPGFDEESFRVAEFQSYYRLIKQRLEDQVTSEPAETYPDPVPQCDICRWWKECDTQRHDDDHLCLVAGIRSDHTTELNEQGIVSLRQYAEEPKPYRQRPRRGAPDTYTKIHGQAQVQLKGRLQAADVYEFLLAEPGRGLSRLPEPTPGDIFFDIESDAFVDDGGLEYLFGWSFINDAGDLEYRSEWATSRAGERVAFEAFMDFVMDRWHRVPGMHVYHYSPYEPSAVKRLMGRHATREQEVDQLLRGERFIDLLAVVRQGLQASVESYSLKELERFCGYERAADLREASAARRRLGYALEIKAPEEITADDHRIVEDYNREDCEATLSLRNWLEERRQELLDQGIEIARPELTDGAASDAVEDRDARVQAVFDRLVDELPEDLDTWTTEHRARWLLAHQLDYFRREDKSAWWEFFRIHDLEFEELLEERKAVAGLKFVGAVGGSDKYPIHRYSFPAQEVSMSTDRQLDEVGANPVGTVSALDLNAETLDIKKRGDSADVHPAAVLVRERVSPKPVDGALLQLAEALAEDELAAQGPNQAARDLLMRRPPRVDGGSGDDLRLADEPTVEAAVRIAESLQESVFAIQGPPGTGKTYTGARIIRALAQAGKRVGVTAVSHKVIQNLLEESLTAGAEDGTPIKCVHKVQSPSEGLPPGYEQTNKQAQVDEAVDRGKVVGGTAWLWARDDMAEALDYLVVDEAGQISLAHVLATSRASKSVILLGDPQQLQQPQRGAHPEGADIAALDYLIRDRHTIAPDQGLFLDETWRLHPDLCALTSELFYDGRLLARPDLANQRLEGPTRFAGAGPAYMPVAHVGNQSGSPEEVQVVREIVDELLNGGNVWIDRGRQEHPMTADDILVVAPYNVQVSDLSEALGDVRVGTVDRFQGQEAPVVIYSMTSSSIEDAPRGFSFLFDPHRFNVATSRGRCRCILVASPRLLEAECRTPEHIRWLNALCRFVEAC